MESLYYSRSLETQAADNVKGEYEAASPCHHIDLPQSLLEPILLRYATKNGFKCRTDTVFEGFEEDKSTGTITSTLRDNITNQQYAIRSRYLFGADGGRSVIMKQLGIPLEGKFKHGLATDIFVRADLTHLIKTRTGNLHWMLQPDTDHPDWAFMICARMVKPWTEWVFHIFPHPDREAPKATEEQYLEKIKVFIGDDTPVKIIKTSQWYIHEVVAEEYSKGNV